MRNGGMDMIDQFGIMLFLRFNSRFVQAFFLASFIFLELLVYEFIRGLLSYFFIRGVIKLIKIGYFLTKTTGKIVLFSFVCD